MAAVLPTSFLENSKPEKPDVTRARQLVLAHGWNSTAFQIVNPGISRWFAAAGDAVVGYVAAGGVRVVVGAPVCERERLRDVAAEFDTDARADGARVCYFAAETALESVVADRGDHSKFLLGAQPAWDPRDWCAMMAGHRSLRAQLTRASNKGVIVSEWPVAIATDHPGLASCLDRWLASKNLPPLHFMVESHTLDRLENRRVFVAKRNDAVVGFVVLSPVAQREGWLFEQFPHAPGAPNGTVELMIDAAMRSVASEGCSYATLGLSPLSKRAEIDPVDQPLWLNVILGWVRKHGQRFYNFDGLDAFKAKLRPSRWEPVFALSKEPEVSVRTLYAIAAAFSGNAPYALVIGTIRKAIATELRWIRSRLTD
jgi:phosphatidylglycerol lysyltransferase